MHFPSLILAASVALTAMAGPTNYTNTLEPREPGRDRRPETFRINVINKCKWTKQVALYQITGKFKMLQKSKPRNIPSGKSTIINAPFHAKGMRLSGHAEWGTDAQWRAQALFEFGHSVYAGKEGTAYNLSVMKGSDGDIGIGAYPIGRDATCPSKTCFPWYCPPSQGWTDPGQVHEGSPADTTCYKGKTDFKVVFCP